MEGICLYWHFILHFSTLVRYNVTTTVWRSTTTGPSDIICSDMACPVYKIFYIFQIFHLTYCSIRCVFIGDVITKIYGSPYVHFLWLAAFNLCSTWFSIEFVHDLDFWSQKWKISWCWPFNPYNWFQLVLFDLILSVSFTNQW